MFRYIDLYVDVGIYIFMFYATINIYYTKKRERVLNNGKKFIFMGSNHFFFLQNENIYNRVYILCV